MGGNNVADWVMFVFQKYVDLYSKYINELYIPHKIKIKSIFLEQMCQ